MTEIELNVVVNTNLSEDEFTDKFIEWIESIGATVGGCINEVKPDPTPDMNGYVNQ